MTDELPAQWGILELMGHKVIAGKISNLGHPLIRIDVPETKGFPEFTQWYSENAIYCITPTSEEVARKCAQDYSVSPISVYAPSLVSAEKLDETRREVLVLQDMLRAEKQKFLNYSDPDEKN